MDVDIKSIVKKVRDSIPGLIGGIHFINGKRQIEYKIEKVKESFNYRVRVTLNQCINEEEVVVSLIKLAKKGMLAYERHITVVKPHTLYDYDCFSMHKDVSFETTYGSFGSRFRDEKNKSKYRQFSIKKYGIKLAFKLAKLNAFLIKNPQYISNFQIKNSKYITKANDKNSLQVRIEFPEASFSYKSYITTNIKSIDIRINYILADLVCKHALNLYKNLHTVCRLPSGIFGYKYKNAIVFETKIWNEATQKWSNRYKSSLNNPNAYKEIVQIREQRLKDRPRISGSKRMSPKHYQIMKEAVRSYIGKEITVEQIRKNWIADGKTESELRWMFFAAATAVCEQKGTTIFDDLYTYLSDQNIEFGIKHILDELSANK